MDIKDKGKRACIAEGFRIIDEEQRLIGGYITTEEVDSYGTYFTLEASRKAVEKWARMGNFRYMHQMDVVGKLMTWYMDERGVYVESRLVDDAVWNKAKNGLLNGYSIGFNNAKGKFDEDKDAYRIESYDLVEVSYVDSPSNPGAIIDNVRNQNTQNKGDDSMGTELTPRVEKLLRSKGMDGVVDIVENYPDLERRLSEAETNAKKLEAELKTAKDELAKRDKAEIETRIAEFTEIVGKTEGDKKDKDADIETYRALLATSPDLAKRYADDYAKRGKTELLDNQTVTDPGNPVVTKGADADDKKIRALASEKDISYNEAFKIFYQEKQDRIAEGVQ